MGRDYTGALYVEVEGAPLWHVCKLTYLDTYVMNGFHTHEFTRAEEKNRATTRQLAIDLKFSKFPLRVKHDRTLEQLWGEDVKRSIF